MLLDGCSFVFAHVGVILGITTARVAVALRDRVALDVVRSGEIVCLDGEGVGDLDGDGEVADSVGEMSPVSAFDTVWLLILRLNREAQFSTSQSEACGRSLPTYPHPGSVIHIDCGQHQPMRSDHFPNRISAYRPYNRTTPR